MPPRRATPRKAAQAGLRLPPARPRKEDVYFIGACNVRLDSLDPAAKVPSWETFTTAPEHQVFVIEDGSHIAGYAHVCASRDEPDSSTGEVTSIYVLPSLWRKGLGTALLRTAERALIAQGHHSITLWVLEANTLARQFYERSGYLADGAAKLHPKSGLRELRYRRSARAAG